MPITSRPGCRVCFAIKRDEINDLLLQGVSMNKIEGLMRDDGFPIKRETIGRHLAECLHGDVRNVELPTAAHDAEQRIMDGTSTNPKNDFAVIVHAKAVEDLNRGRLRVSTKDGLMARALLDKREERAEDRQFVLNLARVLSGGGAATPEALTDGTIDGEYKDVTPNPALAPAELRVP